MLGVQVVVSCILNRQDIFNKCIRNFSDCDGREISTRYLLCFGSSFFRSLETALEILNDHFLLLGML